jgi:FeS assembly protein IscX
MKWTDVRELAESLAERHVGTDPRTIRFTDLHAWIVALPDFTDEPRRSNEKILEAIQMAWIDEVD